MIAQFTTWCHECEQPITPGQEIMKDGPTQPWRHTVCPETLPEKPVKVCPKCFLALPATGKCDCDE